MHVKESAGLISSRPAVPHLRRGCGRWRSRCGEVGFFQKGDVLGGQGHVQGCGDIVKVGGLGGTDDGCGNAFGPFPRQGNLLHLYAVMLGQGVHPLHDLHVLLFGAVILAHGNAVGFAAQSVSGPGGAG